jgi:hypothetical protein
MLKHHAERKNGRFTVTSEVELDDGTVLAPGSYEGRSTHLGFIRHEEYAWADKRHILELDAEQIACMGGRAPEHTTLVEYDVTKQVEDGLIRIEQSILS